MPKNYGHQFSFEKFEYQDDFLLNFIIKIVNLQNLLMVLKKINCWISRFKTMLQRFDFPDELSPMQAKWDMNKFLDFWEIKFSGILLSNKCKYSANFHSRPKRNISRTQI